MKTFVIVCAAMVAAALLWLIVPLLRTKAAAGEPLRTAERWMPALIVIAIVPAVTALMYASLSNWDWQRAEATDLLGQLEQKLQSNPEDLEGWLLLGRAYAQMEAYPRALNAYERAYNLSRGENLEALIGLAESLAITDQNALAGRAGELFEQALARAPNNPKALWYGAIAALQANDLRKGRDRLQQLLAQNPPPEIRDILQRQIQDLDQQIGEGWKDADPASAGRSIQVAVSVAPEIERQIKEPLTLFVLARDPAGGPPLAVQRHSSAQLPFTVRLTEQDAMTPSRTLASLERVQVVARLSRTGTPQAQSGDFFGQADYEFGKDAGTLNIRIDQTVP
ncbi:MAG TPA: tetratricopeptide repeat protein [Steroidobacteraceae bacterium]